ncbi:hypothetical protein COCOBI_07-3420 [Coccomyxa sp. Obi]|nr:hypothetical protein COCOBI_07-3420 [Coccomyxa sp. Obi]
MKSLLHFSPPEDPRISLTARLAASTKVGDSLKRVQLGDNHYGSANVRFQTTPVNPSNFVDIKVSTQGEGTARVRGCYHDPRTGLGLFGILPVVTEDLEATPDASVGLRYSTSKVSLGIVANPTSESVNQIWAVAREGTLTAGLQLKAPHLEDLLRKHPGEALKEAQSVSSFAFAYSPAGTAIGRGQFTAAIEVQEQKRLILSFLHHMAVQRLCKNPLEDEEVVGITNYLDIGLQVVTNIARKHNRVDTSNIDGMAKDVSNADANLRLGAAWQVNKNVLVKGRVGTDAAVASLAFKAWWQPSFTFAASAGYDLRNHKPRVGLVFNVENYGNIRYERGQRTAFGGALVQRHVALPQDLANKEGKGLLVQRDDLDNARILGQTTTDASFVL